MSKIFLTPPWGIVEFKWSPSPHVIIKAWAELVSVFEAEIDYALGLLKVKAGNLRGILSYLSKTTKFASYQYPLQEL